VRVIVAAVTMVSSAVSAAQPVHPIPPPDLMNYTLRAVRIETGEAPTIDGDLSDPVWAKAAVLDDFRQADPDTGQPGSEKTVLRILYDADNIYFSIYCYDREPDKIIVRGMTRDGPVFAGSLFPFVFITIACGALSGFHSLISSGTTPKMIQKETQIRMIGYGSMLMESSVAVMALVAASIIDPGLYFAMNAPSGVIGSTVESASQAVANLGYTISPADLAKAAEQVEEATLLSRTGGAPTLALGVSDIFSQVTGGSLRAFWYHFAIMF